MAEKILTISLCIFLILVTILGFTFFQLRTEDAHTEIVDCLIVDKYFRHSKRGNTNSYYLILQFESKNGEYEETIDISEQEFYEKVKIGDILSCKVTYDEHGILELEDLSGKLSPYSVPDSIKSFLWIITGIVLFFTVIFVLIFGIPWFNRKIQGRTN